MVIANTSLNKVASQGNAICIKAHLPKVSRNKFNIKLSKDKILLVEDNNFFIHGVLHFFNKIGYKNIIAAKSANEALQLFSADIKLLLIDISLPDMNGYDLCKKIRSEINNKTLPIIAFADHEDFLIKQCRGAGMDGVILKSASFYEFQSMIQRFLGKNIKNVSKTVNLI